MRPKPTFGEAFLFWLKLGFISFGGPTGQIAIMHTELVDRRRWISESRFLHALNYCMLLPGPEAQQLATYIGWLLHGSWGGIAAGVLFVLPSAVLLWLLSFVYITYGNVGWIAAVFDGLKPAVMAIVAHAVLRIGRRALRTRFAWMVSGAAFAAIFFFHVPFPLIILAAGLLGLALHGSRWRGLVESKGGRHGSLGHSLDDDTAFSESVSAKPTIVRALRVLVVCLLLWFVPILAAGASLGWDHTLVHEGLFFSKAAMVTFGGAYAVLPYVAQQAVERYGWLSAGQMLDGLGLAETTPGPLIMVVQFVGFLGGWNHPGGQSPLFMATLGALMTTWVTFVPCFLWIFLGAPYIERMRQHVRLSAALSMITAAVVGVVLNLAVWFGIQVLFPASGTFHWFAAIVAVGAMIALEVGRWSVPLVVLGGCLMGLLRSAIF